jgi:hypothetical protein
MEFLPEREFWRRFVAARRARANELMALSIDKVSASRQAEKEFSMYDRCVIDERGWIGFEGLDLPE